MICWAAVFFAKLPSWYLFLLLIKWEANLFGRLHEFSWWLNAKCIPSHLIESSNQAANVLELVVATLDGDWEKHKLSTKVNSASCSQHFVTFNDEARFKRKHKCKMWKPVHTELAKVRGWNGFDSFNSEFYIFVRNTYVSKKQQFSLCSSK